MTRTKTGGRTANTPNKINAQAKEIILTVVNDEVAKIPSLLDKLKPKDRLEIVIKLMSFVVPRQTKIQLDTELTVKPDLSILSTDELIKRAKAINKLHQNN